MSENLAFKPNNGGAWAYDNNRDNLKTYGYLYDWETACKVCPSGWHLPSDAEWNRLINFLGGAELAGHKMKSAWAWKDGGNGNNVSGFNGFPGGGRNTNGTFYSIGINGYSWSSSETNTSFAWYRNLYYNSGSVNRGKYGKSNGFSVRCLRD
jgi:uncharacterized protein (TIGR02145 family)